VTGLTRIDWPDNGVPEVPHPPTLADYQTRLAETRESARTEGLEALVIYADREHAANMHWLTGFDPRFEEAVMVVTPADALLILGNECLPYAAVSPLVQDGALRVAHCAALSLPSQPRGGARLADILAGVLPEGGTIGAVGWKWFDADEVDDPKTALDIPAFLADPLRRIADHVYNATDLFMHPAYGLRTRVDVDEIVRLEFANDMAARALRRMVFAFRDGMTDFAAIEAARLGGLPLSCHLTFATGARAGQGLSGPTGQVLRKGSQISFNIAHWGSNICRAGWVARGPKDLPAPARDYVEAFVQPYVLAMSDWCEHMRPGVTGGAVWQRMREALPLDQFGVHLNPGHLIGLDEWISSPIAEGSKIPLAPGMAMQMDVIPEHAVYGSTRMEDGYAIIDADMLSDLQDRYPDVAERCAKRRAFMRDVIGMDVPYTLLPLADTCGIVAPFLLAPKQVVTL
jgi:Xaa-Pro aminopeptidase